MEFAVALAAKGKFTAKPNPLVGSVIVNNNEIVGQGYHQNYGGNHAEINAINSVYKKYKKAKDILKESTLFCTLEPCNHDGKTPPCTNAIIQSGIKNIIIGAIDPNPKVSGTGINKLIQHGLQVQSGVCENLVEDQNKFFFFRHRKKRPFITLKIAASKDGKAFLQNSDERTIITSSEARADVQLIRAEYDSILTGGNTLRKDNPKMNARVEFNVNQPQKILLSTEIHSKKYEFFKNNDVLIFNDKNVSINSIIKKLSASEINSILVEAGPKLVNAFLKTSLVDQVIYFEAPHNLGSHGMPWFDTDNYLELNGFQRSSSSRIGPDKKIIFSKND